MEMRLDRRVDPEELEKALHNFTLHKYPLAEHFFYFLEMDTTSSAALTLEYQGHETLIRVSELKGRQAALTAAKLLEVNL